MSRSSPLLSQASGHYGSISFDFGKEDYFHPIAALVDKDETTLPTSSTDSTFATSETHSLCGHPLHDQSSTLWGDAFLSLLGFSQSPFGTYSGTRNTVASDMRLAMLSNFSTAYNIVSISLALHVMERIYPATTPEDKSFCASALIAGMIFGQLIGGTIGDVLGRHMGMAIVMSLQVIGALASALSVDGRYSIYLQIAAFRFILGLGCGGVYPLAATITAESSDNKEDGAKRTSVTFSMQGVGYLAAPLFAWILLSILPEESDIVWRLLLGCGSIPGLALMILRMRRRACTEIPPTEPRPRPVPVSVLDAIVMEENLIRKMLGTGGCWLLFDVLFYGNTLFQPIVLESAFGDSETLKKTARDTVIIAAISLPGYFASVIAVGRQSPRLIQAQGFLVMGVLYAFIGFNFLALTHEKFLLMALYGSTFFFSNYGPNATTFILPSLTFSRPCRSTLNGFCAACGKAGALIGTMFFATAAADFGQEAVMMACGLISFIGMMVTLACVAERVCEEATKAEEVSMEERLSQVPMKVVYSVPSLMDYFEDV